MEFSIVGIRFNKWKNTYWKGQIVPLEVIRSEIPKYQGRHAVTIYGKVLGLIPTNQEKLPIGCRVFVTLNTCKNYVKVKIVDKPSDWLSPFSNGLGEYFSSEFISSIDEESLYDDFDIYNDFEEKYSPIEFHEWLLRMGKNEKYADISTVQEYIFFREWLTTEEYIFFRERVTTKVRKKINFLGDNWFCEDEQIEAYKEYCRKQEEIDSWDSLGSRTDIEAEYGGGAWMDNEGAIFDDDGECIGIY